MRQAPGSRGRRWGRISIVSLTLLLTTSCGLKNAGAGIPPEVESVIGTVTDDIAQERYDKVYSESSELWKHDASQEQSTEVLKTLHARLGKVENRAMNSATEQQNSGGPLKGHAFIITYQTKFERGEAMETFTVIEENGRWKLARYLVSSTGLK